MKKVELTEGKEKKVLEEIGILKKTTYVIGEKVSEMRKNAPSYVGKAIGPQTTYPPPTTESKFAVIVTSEGTEDNGSELTKKIRGSLNARSTGIEIQSIRKI